MQGSSKISASLSCVCVEHTLKIWMQYNFALLGVSYDLFLLPDTENLCGLDVTVFWQKNAKKYFAAPLFFAESF